MQETEETNLPIANKGDYTAENIQVLEGLEAVENGPPCTSAIPVLKDCII